MSQQPKLHLFHYWRSSASWRTRWALELKGVECELTHVHILNGESEGAEHLKRNPLGYVPALEVDGKFLIESIAIIHWLDETFPTPPLLPQDAWTRAQARILAEIVNASTQPLINVAPTQMHSQDPAEQKRWMQHWIRNGLSAYEALVKPTAGQFSIGDQITLADLCLIPQCYSALRNDIPLEEFPTIKGIWERAKKTEACQRSAPEHYEPKQYK